MKCGIFVLFLATAFLLSACERHSNHPSIVLITVDTLRADHLGSYGYFRNTSPTMDALAKEGVRFETAATPTSYTTPAHFALFTARYPMQTGMISNGRRLWETASKDREVFLAEILEAKGYKTGAFVSAATTREGTGLNAGFDHFDDFENQKEDEEEDERLHGGERRSDETVDHALAWMNKQGDRPFFAWVHLFAPHDPYHPPEAYQGMFQTDAALLNWLEEREFPSKGAEMIREVHNAYDGEVRYADDQIARIVRQLKEMGIYDESAVVVTSDHGEGLGQHGWLFHGHIFNEQLFVPLIFKWPAQMNMQGIVHSEMVSLIDVVPTLLDTLELSGDVASRSSMEGINVFALEGKRGAILAHRFQDLDTIARRKKLKKRAIAEGTHKPPTDDERPQRALGKQPRPQRFAVLKGSWKLSVFRGGKRRLYDLAQNPNETVNVAKKHPEITSELTRDLDAMLKRFSQEGPLFEVMDEVSPKVIEQLKALGYLQE